MLYVVSGLFVKYIEKVPYFLVGLRDKDHPGAGYWEFPGGKKDLIVDVLTDSEKVSNYETDEIALVREIKEELNANIKIKKFIKTTVVDNLNINLYLCEFLDDPVDFILTAHDKVEWKNLNDLRHLNSLLPSLSDVFGYLEENF